MHLNVYGKSIYSDSDAVIASQAEILKSALLSPPHSLPFHHPIHRLHIYIYIYLWMTIDIYIKILFQNTNSLLFSRPAINVCLVKSEYLQPQDSQKA